MGILKKYEFTSKTKYNNTLKLLDFTTKHKPFVFGKMILKTAEYINGEEVKPFVLSQKYCVDIYWSDNEDSSLFDEFEVFTKNQKHKKA